MPTLPLSVTAEQAARIEPALRDRYRGTALASKPLADMATDFLLSAVRELVTNYERNQAQGKIQIAEF